VPIQYRGARYTSAPAVVFTANPSSDQITAAVASSTIGADTATKVSGGSGYAVNDILIVSGGTFTMPVKLKVDSVAAGVIGNFHIHDYGQYTVAPSNNVSVTGGAGTGATFTIYFSVNSVTVTNGGLYKSRPTATPSGGSPQNAAVFGTLIMGNPQSLNDGTLTVPFHQIGTVKDTVTFTLSDTDNTGTTTLHCRCITYIGGPLPYTHVVSGGQDYLQSSTNSALPPLDGSVVPNVGDRILVVSSGTPDGGVYSVTNLGVQGVTPWRMDRVPEMDQSTEVNTNVFVDVSEGDTGAGLWQCTVTGSFTIDVDPITFVKVNGPFNHTPTFKITIDYHAIELHYEYMAKTFAPKPRWLRHEYQRNSDGLIIIHPAVGEAMVLDIDSVVAIVQIVTRDASNNITSVSDGSQVTITEDTWRPRVKYIGTTAQFEQIPAGQYWHVREQATIKIVPDTAL